jgi:hypothetical protein
MSKTARIDYDWREIVRKGLDAGIVHPGPRSLSDLEVSRLITEKNLLEKQKSAHEKKTAPQALR